MGAGGSSGGGAGGAAGSGLGGTGGSGTDDAGPTDAVPSSTTGQFTVIYGGTMTRTLTTCLNCTAFYDSSINYGSAGFEMANAGGASSSTLVVMSITRGFAADWEVSIHWAEGDPTLPPVYQTSYYFSSGEVAIQVTPTSCVTLTSVSLGVGGGFAGSFDCTFSGGLDANRVSAQMRGTFSAKFD